MSHSKTLIAAGIGALTLVLVLAALGTTTQAAQPGQDDKQDKQKDETEHHTVLQFDIANEFAPFGQAGFFKLLADFTDMHAEGAHVAVSNVQCDDEGASPFGIVVANANVGTGNTDLAVIPLNATNLINDVSFNGTACTYHVDIEEDDFDFPVTDIALANTNDTNSYTPLPTASATIHAELAEEENEVEEVLGESSEVSIGTVIGGELEVELKDGDLADGVYNVTLSCAEPEVSTEFEDALTVKDGEGVFETTHDLAEGSYEDCGVTAGDLKATFAPFEVTADEDLGEEDDEQEEDDDEETEE